MTPEEAKAWVDEVDELGSSLFAGREVTHEEFLQLGDYYLNGKYLINSLKIVRKEKLEALEEVASLEAVEQSILKRMKEQNIEE
ncbi:MAG: hypothetical protein HC815_06000 [Richelia sp. RM1_1_1]|nr:hypothetical protein [Richelia sp. RM1_1_1]